MDPLRFIKRWREEHGAELVEFALTFPLLLLVLVGIMDFGLLFQRYEVLTNAVREGARVGVLPNYNAADIQNRVNQYLLGTSLSGATVTTTVGAAQVVSIGGGRCISVVPVESSYNHQYTFISGIARYFNQSFGSRTLVARANMRKETGAVACP